MLSFVMLRPMVGMGPALIGFWTSANRVGAGPHRSLPFPLLSRGLAGGSTSWHCRRSARYARTSDDRIFSV